MIDHAVCFPFIGLLSRLSLQHIDCMKRTDGCVKRRVHCFYSFLHFVVQAEQNWASIRGRVSPWAKGTGSPSEIFNSFLAIYLLDF